MRLLRTRTADHPATHAIECWLQDALRNYTNAMRSAGFTSNLPLYVASGLLGYNDTASASAAARATGRRSKAHGGDRGGICLSALCYAVTPRLPAGFDTVVQRLRKEGLAHTVVTKEHILGTDDLAGERQRGWVGVRCGTRTAMRPCAGCISWAGPACRVPRTCARTACTYGTWPDAARPPASHACTGLHTEQLALIDLLVLIRAARLVGYNLSTFSYAMRDLRALRGLGAPDTCLLIPHHNRAGHRGWEGLMSITQAPWARSTYP